MICDGKYDCSTGRDETFCGQDCGYDVSLATGESVIVNSPNYPDNYSDNVNCFWTITNKHAGSIRLAFDSFETEELYDYVQYGTGLVPYADTYRHHGNVIPRALTSTQSVWITFYSDRSVTNLGFEIVASAFGECAFHSRLRSLETLEIASPSYPNNYGNNVYCIWTFTNEDGGQIQIHFHHFQTEAFYDYLQIGNGTLPGPNASMHYGNNIPETFQSYGYEAWMTFRSDDIVSGSGFLATVSATDECKYEYKLNQADEITITSPNYPYNYHENIECTWIITTNTVWGRIGLFFNSFDTELYYDTVSFGSGTTPNYDIGFHHGDDIPENYTTTGGEVWIAFDSDYSVVGKGFQLTAFVIVKNCTNDGMCDRDEDLSEMSSGNYHNND
ncbi:CUB domain-containing protein 2-like [Ptychodera flava]|uniref:CUB domain-containing protein 2-like n=1 Tax=Ptychodera flava TaxID=63121 RepID=UPI00396A6D51